MRCARCGDDDIDGPACSCGLNHVPASVRVASRPDLIDDLGHWRRRARSAEARVKQLEAELDRKQPPVRLCGYCGVYQTPGRCV